MPRMSDEKIVEIIRYGLEQVRTEKMSEFSFVLMCNNIVNYKEPTEAGFKWARDVAKRLGVGTPTVRGQKVLVRCAGDELRCRLIWDTDSTHIFICDEEDFAILSSGAEYDGDNPLGFPRRFIFKYDESIAAEFLNKDGLGDDVWSRLERWTKPAPAHGAEE